MNQLTFKVEKMFRFADSKSLKAFVDVSVNDLLVIKGVRLVEGKKGLFVTMPQELGKDDRWYDQIICKSPALQEELSREVISFYQNSN